MTLHIFQVGWQTCLNFYIDFLQMNSTIKKQFFKKSKYTYNHLSNLSGTLLLKSNNYKLNQLTKQVAQNWKAPFVIVLSCIVFGIFLHPDMNAVCTLQLLMSLCLLRLTFSFCFTSSKNFRLQFGRPTET